MQFGKPQYPKDADQLLVQRKTQKYKGEGELIRRMELNKSAWLFSEAGDSSLKL